MYRTLCDISIGQKKGRMDDCKIKKKEQLPGVIVGHTKKECPGQQKEWNSWKIEMSGWQFRYA